MEHAQPVPAPFPWRAATIVVGALALVELVALIALGLVQLVPSSKPHAKPVAAVRSAVHVQRRAASHVPAVPLRPRSRVRVLVLNGNGVSGAAAAAASRLRGDGYRIAGATNAQRHDYARSMVMFVPGWVREARRLARDNGIHMVSPVDGLRRSQLKGSTVILLLGT